MWPFGRQTRIPQHKALLTTAEQVLSRFPPQPPAFKDGDVWFDLSSVPLEFRKHVEASLESIHVHLGCAKHDRDAFGKPYLGSAEYMRDLAQDVRFMQLYLSDTFPPQGRLAFRAEIYADLFKDVAEHVPALQQPNAIIRETTATLLSVADEVLSWFPDEASLDEAKRALGSSSRLEFLPRVAAAALADKMRQFLREHPED